MKHIILVSHGQFASGLKSAIGVVMGMADEITALGLEEGMDIKTFREKFLEILNQIPKEDEIILLCDIIGDSPFTSSAELLRSLILTGMNMPVLVQLLLQKDDSALEQLKSEVKAISAGTIQIFEEESEDEDEEL
jgi:PTS system N-acetylgalactosamine-specific IIA component